MRCNPYFKILNLPERDISDRGRTFAKANRVKENFHCTLNLVGRFTHLSLFFLSFHFLPDSSLSYTLCRGKKLACKVSSFVLYRHVIS